VTWCGRYFRILAKTKSSKYWKKQLWNSVQKNKYFLHNSSIPFPPDFQHSYFTQKIAVTMSHYKLLERKAVMEIIFYQNRVKKVGSNSNIFYLNLEVTCLNRSQDTEYTEYSYGFSEFLQTNFRIISLLRSWLLPNLMLHSPRHWQHC
jgi:hypothetical protein